MRYRLKPVSGKQEVSLDEGELTLDERATVAGG
jgi:hypothetical protein